MDTVNGVQRNERQLVTCRAIAGTFLLSFRNEYTKPIAATASSAEFTAAITALKTVSSNFDMPAFQVAFDGETACSANGNAIDITFLQDFGDLPQFVADGSLLEGGGILTAAILVGTTFDGAKENEHCSNRGLCDTDTGICECSDEAYESSNGYGAAGIRGDCGKNIDSITACPGETPCSGHGICSGTPTFRCSCSGGWTGADCTLMLCPEGTDWFAMPSAAETGHLTTAECSNQGICDRTTGMCGCMEGFTGGACQYRMCPGSPECTGQGMCLTLAAIAEKGDVNGVIQGWSYGLTPNNPLTWDYDKMMGCYCDVGFTGYDCSLRTCAHGDDPLTIHQDNEMQILECTSVMDDDGDMGQFYLTFREQTTTSISSQATVADVEAALEALSTVGDVSVRLADGYTDVCKSTTSKIEIEFLYPTGDVPMLGVAVDGITVAMEEKVKGTKEFKECSGRGLCDPATGDCTCDLGFLASDGQGKIGQIPNCGFKTPILKPEE